MTCFYQPWLYFLLPSIWEISLSWETIRFLKDTIDLALKHFTFLELADDTSENKTHHKNEQDKWMWMI